MLKEKERDRESELKKQMEDAMKKLEARIDRSLTTIEKRPDPVKEGEVIGTKSPAFSIQKLYELSGTDPPATCQAPTAPPLQFSPPPYNPLPNTRSIASASNDKIISGRRSGVIRDAILEGDWQLAC